LDSGSERFKITFHCEINIDQTSLRRNNIPANYGKYSLSNYAANQKHLHARVIGNRQHS
jgi:hypothetical protein